MSINSYISKQFSNPKGLGSSLISLIMNRQNRPLYDATIQLLSLADTDRVLDIGCGNGYVMSLLARTHNSEFSGIDKSADVVEAAARRNREYIKNNRMSFSCQDVSSLTFPDSCFSKAYTINTVYFWNGLNKPMSEIRRVLKQGGVFINTLYTNETLSRFSHTKFGYNRYEAEKLTAAGENAGFTVKVVPILRGAAHCYVYIKNEDDKT